MRVRQQWGAALLTLQYSPPGFDHLP